ncbi:glycoside hydrolase domain-containing protein [Streptomyces sp. NBC_01465]|uniref:glycoside hydrolase domain-containing protein n=1 Tax=Streptomyces sp. NBC_01465 TaxID=2903878 RepID=UPI002E37F318|nr:glycoside hydrolase domain-containing protein [Streptomyces sp. NBC_01465]
MGETGYPELNHGLASWDNDVYGNHRILVRVPRTDPTALAVAAELPWRRHDPDPEAVDLVVLAPSGDRVRNVVRTEVTADRGRIAFEPVDGPGTYAVHYLPYAHTGNPHYPQSEYRRPTATAHPAWVQRCGLRSPGTWHKLPRAEAFRYEAASAVDSFAPLGFAATAAETAALTAAHPGEPFLVFAENRAHPLGRASFIPARWAATGPFAPFKGAARRGEFYALQAGVHAVRPLTGVHAEVRGLPFPVRAITQGGTDARGETFEKDIAIGEGQLLSLWFGLDIPKDAVPGAYEGEIAVRADGAPERTLPVMIAVGEDAVEEHGAGDPASLARLRWLDSTLGHDDELVPPFTPVKADGRQLAILGRMVELGHDGLPTRITSSFTSDVTRTDGPPRDLLAAPVTFDVGRPLDQGPLTVTLPGPARAHWHTEATGEGLRLRTEGELEADGFLRIRTTVEALTDTTLDVTLDVPVRAEATPFVMGLGLRGQKCPASYDWTWQTAVHNQDALWLGGPSAGVQLSLRDEHYARPLNTNYYREKPLVTPRSWAGDGDGGVRLRTADGTRTLTAHSDTATLAAGESRCFELRLLLTPFKPIIPGRHLAERYFHAYADPAEIAAYGANVVNIHHATPPNPYINDPLLEAGALRAYTDEAHSLGIRVKVYNTVRELTRQTPELPVLASLGDEVLAPGPGGGHAWLREHLGDGYVPGWVAPDIGDVAVVTSGDSRWHNSYVCAVDRLRRHVGVDGLYLDDVAFDRTTMKRVRKVLAGSGETPPLIDLHSCNQYREADGFASSANLYAELMPYTDRLWLGELFDYEGTDPAYWLVEISGIPFGLMGEMLEGGGNPWRGLVFGMTARAPMTDVRPLWRAFDQLGLEQAEMTGWWAEAPLVRTGRDDILATSWRGPGLAVTAIASWADGPAEAVLSDASGPVAAYAPEITGFQPERRFAAGEPVPVEPGRGWLLRLG